MDPRKELLRRKFGPKKVEPVKMNRHIIFSDSSDSETQKKETYAERVKMSLSPKPAAEETVEEKLAECLEDSTWNLNESSKLKAEKKERKKAKKAKKALEEKLFKEKMEKKAKKAAAKKAKKEAEAKKAPRDLDTSSESGGSTPRIPSPIDGSPMKNIGVTSQSQKYSTPKKAAENYVTSVTVFKTPEKELEMLSISGSCSKKGVASPENEECDQSSTEIIPGKAHNSPNTRTFAVHSEDSSEEYGRDMMNDAILPTPAPSRVLPGYKGRRSSSEDKAAESGSSKLKKKVVRVPVKCPICGNMVKYFNKHWKQTKGHEDTYAKEGDYEKYSKIAHRRDYITVWLSDNENPKRPTVA
uniref:C2H2-type domain-containing protein n=1 Tax=Parastrongyloides trichosuri TaxID=131310 RepID=A0A0N4Z1J9_PARTI